MVAALLLVFAEWQQGTLHVVDSFGLPLLALFFGVLSFHLWRQTISIARLETAVFGGTALMYLSSLAFSLFGLSQTQAALWNLTGLGYWSSVVYTLAFLVFGVKSGLKTSLGVYLLSLFAWLTHFALLFLAGDPPMGEAVFYQLFASDGLLLIMLYGTAQAFAAQAQQSVRLEQDANTDALTQLYNRRFLGERLAQETARSLRQAQPLTLMIIDLDHFKKVNDDYGHSVGDRVLQGVSRCLLDHARKMDVVGRWGGEEFLIMLPGTPLPEALETAERLRAVVELCPAEVCPDEVKRAVTASFGVAQYCPGEEVRVLLERADRALYRAKRAGRNRVSGDDSFSGVATTPVSNIKLP